MKVITVRPVRRRTAEFDRLPKLDAAKLRAQLRGAQVVTESTRREGLETFARVRAETRGEFRRMFEAQRPDVVERYKRDDGPFLAPSAGGPDGSSEHLLVNREAQIRDMVQGRRMLEDRDHLARQYASLHGGSRGPLARAAGKDRRTAAVFAELPAVREVRGLDAAELSDLIVRVSKLILEVLIPRDGGKPRKYPKKCSAEEGTGFGGDAPAATTDTPNPLGCGSSRLGR